jgi:hypothetical protein
VNPEYFCFSFMFKHSFTEVQWLPMSTLAPQSIKLMVFMMSAKARPFTLELELRTELKRPLGLALGMITNIRLRL